MISVTVAAHRGSKRVVGGHLKAYGSGRLSICDLDTPWSSGKKVPKEKQLKSHWCNFLEKILEAVFAFFGMCFPFVVQFFEHKKPSLLEDGKRGNQSGRSVRIPNPPIHKMTDKLLLRIFSQLTGESTVSCERVCKKWNRVVRKNVDRLPKIMKDQIRILFDEGEIIIYPVDEKRFPVRYPMPNLQTLSMRLRHLQTLSLFVRGLIPVEASPVLRSFCALHLQPQQIYFIWSKFSAESMPLLDELIVRNKDCLSDIGFEECSPTTLFSDTLFQPVLHRLSSLRLWNNGKSGLHEITDNTIYELARSLREDPKLETLDLASCKVTPMAICTLISTWYSNPRSDLNISLNYCPTIFRHNLEDVLQKDRITMKNGKLLENGYGLSLFCGQ